ncbi:MAG: hypothetical protein GY913_34135 [Proteobacteria bacterium]|nr:hypothetical protein [Pseudomonadota bacterium]MCP4921969.1 hypothetical protein [Pseudomonadota bacterium]
MEPIVEPLAAWKTVLPALPALALLLFGVFRVRLAVSPSRWFALVLAPAAAVRLLWMPISRHVFDGHEAEYLDLWMGTRELTQGGTMLYPAMQWLYRGLGVVLPLQNGPLMLNLAASLVAISALYGFVSRLSEERIGLASAVLLGLWGTHAFWSSSAYNVMIPHALALVALWGLAVLVDEEDHRLGAACVAGGAAALAVACRVESVLIAPVGVALLAVARPKKVALWLPPLILGALLGAAAAALVLVPGGTVAPGAGQRSAAFAVNQSLLAYFAPFDRAWTWLPLLVGAGLGARRYPRLFVPLILFVPAMHLVFATFDDYGFRHQITSLAALAALLAGLVLDRRAWVLLPVAGVALLLHTQDVASRYYASEQVYGESLDMELPRRGLSSLGGCALVNEDSRVVPEEQQLSHFNLVEPEEEARLRTEHGCIHWLRTVQDHRWSSRGVRARTLRLEHLYELTPLAVITDESGFVGELVEVGARK